MLPAVFVNPSKKVLHQTRLSKAGGRSRFVPFVNDVKDVQCQKLSSARYWFRGDLCHCPCETANLQDPKLIQLLGKWQYRKYNEQLERQTLGVPASREMKSTIWKPHGMAWGSHKSIKCSHSQMWSTNLAVGLSETNLIHTEMCTSRWCNSLRPIYLSSLG